MRDNELSFLEVLDLVSKIQQMLGATSCIYNEFDQNIVWVFGFANNKPPFVLDEKCLCSFYQRLINSTGVKQ